MAEKSPGSSTDQVRDDNLRLILSKDHETHLSSMIRERFIANACIAAIWIGPLAIGIIWVRFFPESASQIMQTENLGRYIVFPGAILLVLFLPVPILVIPRNMWMARKYVKYYEGHAEFLEKYKRNTDAARARIERFAGFLYMFSVLMMILILYVWLSSAILISRGEKADSAPFDMGRPEHPSTFGISREGAAKIMTPPTQTQMSDRDMCLWASFGNPTGEDEVRRRGLTPEHCKELLGQ